MKRRLSLAYALFWVGCATSGDILSGAETDMRGDNANTPPTHDGGDTDADAQAAPPNPPEPDPDGSVKGDDAASLEEDAGPAPTSPEPSGKVPAFVATGTCVRHLLSCDAGRTWVHDAREEQNCPESTAAWYADHAAHTSIVGSVAYGDGVFVATWGWGEAGKVLRSTDGITWAPTEVSEREWFGGVAYGNGMFVVGRPRQEGYLSRDGGATWSRLAPQAGFDNGAYRARSTDFVLGRFVMMDHDGGSVTSSQVWTTATGSGDFERLEASNTGCAPWSWEEGNGLALGIQYNELASPKGKICRSADLKRVDLVASGDHIQDPLIFAEGQFHFWSNGQRYSSADGSSWTETPLSGGFRGRTQAVAYARELGTYVAITSNWSSLEQRAYRSEDGVNWTEVPFPRGPGIRSVVFGYVEPSPDCPLP